MKPNSKMFLKKLVNLSFIASTPVENKNNYVDNDSDSVDHWSSISVVNHQIMPGQVG